MIVSAATLKGYLKLTTVDANRDAFLAKVSAWAQAIIEGPSMAARKFEKTTYTDEYYNGDGTSLLFLKQYPIVSITSITIDDTAVDNVTDRDYVRYNPNNGGLYLMGAVFTQGFQNVKITYEAGYAAGSEPNEIINAVYELSTIIYKDSDYGKGLVNVASQSLPQGGSESYIHRLSDTTLKAVMALKRHVI